MLQGLSESLYLHKFQAKLLQATFFGGIYIQLIPHRQDVSTDFAVYIALGRTSRTMPASDTRRSPQSDVPMLMYSRFNPFLLLTALFTGCATTTQLVLPDGRVAHEINCVGFGDCRKEAESLCHGRGYDVVGGAFRLPRGQLPQSDAEIAYRYLIITCRQ